MINIGKNKIIKAKKLINSAIALHPSLSSLIICCMITVKENKLEDAANYWFKVLRMREKNVACDNDIEYKMQKIFASCNYMCI